MRILWLYRKNKGTFLYFFMSLSCENLQRNLRLRRWFGCWLWFSSRNGKKNVWSAAGAIRGERAERPFWQKEKKKKIPSISCICEKWIKNEQWDIKWVLPLKLGSLHCDGSHDGQRRGGILIREVTQDAHPPSEKRRWDECLQGELFF